jgi:hypothetical protein
MLLSCRAHATGMPMLDAQDDFRRARRAHAAACVGRLFGRRMSSVRPRTLAESAVAPVGAARLEVVPLRSIVGTVEPTLHFDAEFRPASEVVRARWERIALAHRQGVGLPPVSLWRRCDGYYVFDGRHRVSVARALGHADIDAWVNRCPARAGVGGRPSRQAASSG